jgi:hypothetical protein
VCSILLPDKANAELAVDANAVLACSISLQRLQPIPRRRTQVREMRRRFNLIELSECDRLNASPAFARALREELKRIIVSESS